MRVEVNDRFEHVLGAKQLKLGPTLGYMLAYTAER